jgi:hypothetical protein
MMTESHQVGRRKILDPSTKASFSLFSLFIPTFPNISSFINITPERRTELSYQISVDHTLSEVDRMLIIDKTDIAAEHAEIAEWMYRGGVPGQAAWLPGNTSNVQEATSTVGPVYISDNSNDEENKSQLDKKEDKESEGLHVESGDDNETSGKRKREDDDDFEVRKRY